MQALNTTRDVPEDERIIEVMMIHGCDLVLVAEMDVEKEMLYGYVDIEPDTPEWRETFHLSHMISCQWVPLQFKTPMKFKDALVIATEYKKRSKQFYGAMEEYKKYINTELKTIANQM